MTKFFYEAKKTPTEIVRGSIECDNLKRAAAELGRQGLFIISIQEEGSPEVLSGAVRRFFGRTRQSHIADFTRQLSDLLESGLPVMRALEVLERQTENAQLNQAIRDMIRACTEGRSLSEALSMHPQIFSGLFVSLVRSGETGGALEQILKRHAEYSARQLEIRLKIRSAMAYPALMLAVGLFTILVLLVYVVPKMAVMFGDFGEALPLPTAILLGLSQNLANFALVWLASIALGAAFLIKFYRSPVGKQWVDRWRLRLPIAGPMHQKVEVARFSDTLATLLSNGLSLLESLRVAMDTVTNSVIRRELVGVYDAVKKGSSVSRSFSMVQTFPERVKSMIAIGEESGRLENALLKVAEIYDREIDASIKALLSLLEPLLILILGVVVAFIVLAMLLPIFELSFLGG